MADGSPHPRMRLTAAAEYITVKPRSLGNRTYRQRHGIPTFKLGRVLVFDRAELDAWIAQHREPLGDDSPRVA